jgi:hypothetical protein
MMAREFYDPYGTADVPGTRQYILVEKEDDELEWSEVGRTVLDWGTDVLGAFLTPPKRRPPGLNIKYAQTARADTGFNLERQWPWLALGGVGIVLLMKRS